MSTASVKLIPGLNTEKTLSLNEAGYSYTNLGRFKDGLFQKIGGWKKYYPNLLSGVPYDMHAWQDLKVNNHLAVGQPSNLSVVTSGAEIDITPTSLTTNGATPSVTKFTTAIGTPTVIITDAGMATAQPYDAVLFNTPVAVGGIVLSGMYQIAAYIGANKYSITAATNATSTVTNGGAVPSFTTVNGSANVSVVITAHKISAGATVVFPVSTTVGGLTIVGNYVVSGITDANTFVISSQISASSSTTVSMGGGTTQLVYYLAIGPIPLAGAYGAGLYGAGLYGLGSSTGGTIGTPITTTDWMLSNWGELLVALPKGFPIFYWGPNSGFSAAQPVGSGPAINTGAFVSTGTQILIAYGSSVTAAIGVYQDPLWIQWSDQSNFLQWTPSSTTQAGGFRIPTGSGIVGGISTPNKDLIFTEIEVWAMTYAGQPFIFNINKVGSNCGLIGQHAVCVQSGAVYWMGYNSFFVMDGAGVRPLPCPVWDAVFQDLNVAAGSTYFAMSNSLFNEIWFFYPSLASGSLYPTNYAKFNVLEGVWDTGTLSRMSGVDQNILGSPIMCSPDGAIYQHEVGYNADGSGVPINPVFETGNFTLGNGEDIVFIDRIIPDFKFGLYNSSTNANISITITSSYYPGGTETTHGPFLATSSTQNIPCRIRGRLIRVRVESNDMDSFWRLGNIRFRFASDGRR